MRGLRLALPAVLLSVGAALLLSLFAESDSALSERSAGRAQYNHEDPGSHLVEPPRGARPETGSSDVASPDTQSVGTHESTDPAPRLPQEGGAEESARPADTSPVSEGSLSEARPPAEELSIMEPPEPYSQVVDNASAGHFSAQGWRESAGGDAHYYGKDYSYVEPSRAGAPALFKAKIPTSGHYTVYARWPALEGNNPATRIGISATSGIEWIKVDQRKDGGMWVRLGAYKMEAGTRYPVQVSGYRARGRVVADAVMIVAGTQVAPPETGDTVVGAKGQEIVERARSHIGTPYVHSPPGPCEAHISEDCSCFTSTVFGKWLDLADDPVQQWSYGEEVAKSDLRPGDLVFFKEAGASNPITHVAVYSGRGNIIHASSYWGEVVERPMDSVSGYYGARRLVQY
jgi:cell wall-associated NlpC family hydrolase